MQAHVKDILLEIGVGHGTSHENLLMLPLSGGADPGVEYFSVDEAIGPAPPGDHRSERQRRGAESAGEK